MGKKKFNPFMIFGNPGQVIRVFALITFVAGVIASFIYGIDAAYVEEYYSRYYYSEAEFHFGEFLIIFLSGSAGAWVSGLIFMTIGNTVLNIQRMADKICGSDQKISTAAEMKAAAPAAQTPAAQGVKVEANTPSVKAATASVQAGKDVAEQIKELAAFYQSGALTEEEFNRKKAELLKKL